MRMPVKTQIVILKTDVMKDKSSPELQVLKRKAGHPVVAIRYCHPQCGWSRGWRNGVVAIRISDGGADGVFGGRPLPARCLVAIRLGL